MKIIIFLPDFRMGFGRSTMNEGYVEFGLNTASFLELAELSVC